MEDGTPVTSVEMWNSSRRAEIMDFFRTHVYGHSPAHPTDVEFDVWETDTTLLNNTATRKQVRIKVTGPQGERTINLLLIIPNAAPKPVPLVLYLTSRMIFIDPTLGDPGRYRPTEAFMARGYGIAIVNTSECASEGVDGYKDGLISAFDAEEERREDSWEAIAARAFGGRLSMDYFETDSDVDHSRIGVVGQSRGGKASLWCGAEDPRFAFVMSNNSGCTGASLTRRNVGQSLTNLNSAFPYWMCTNYKAYTEKEDLLPIDQHQLIALMAPRLVYVASAEDDTWADPYGEYLSCYYATPVYELFGLTGMPSTTFPAVNTPVQTGSIGYHVRSGGHAITEYDWMRYLDFADAHLQDNPTSGAVLGFDPTVLVVNSKQADASDPAPREVAIRNVGEKSATIPSLTAESNQSWLTVSVVGGNRKITNTINRSLASFGVNHATVMVKGSGIVSSTYRVRFVYKATPVFTRISVSPSGVSVPPSQSTTLSAISLDQDGDPISPQPVVSWSVSGGGSVDGNGVFTASSSTGGPYTVTATASVGTAVKQAGAEVMVEQLVTRVNAGGGTVSGWDSQDAYVNTTSGNHRTSVAISTHGVAYAGPAALYQTCRNYGTGTTGPAFTFPASLVPDGNYTVRLHFAEPYYATVPVAAEDRKMTVTIGGVDVLAGFSPATGAGIGQKACVWQGSVTVNGGNGLTIALTKGEGTDAFVQGIEIYVAAGSIENGIVSLAPPPAENEKNYPAVFRHKGGIFSIRIPYPGKYSYRIFSMNGAVIASGIGYGPQTCPVTVSPVPAAVYIARIVTPVETIARTFVVTDHR